MKNENSKFDLDADIKLHGKKKPLTEDLFCGVIESVKYYNKKGVVDDFDISFLVVSYNEGDLLLRCLDSIFKQVNCKFEVVLVDNGLDEKTKKNLKKYEITYITTSKNLGCCGGRNVGSVFCHASVIAFIDADGYVADDYGTFVKKTMSDKKILAARGKVKSIKKESVKYVPSGYDLGNEQIETFIDTEGNSVWRKNDFLKVGGFEEELVGGEGVVLCYRMVEFYGYSHDQFVYNPELILYHAFSRSGSRLQKKIRRNTVINHKLDLFYPFLESFKNHYVPERNKRIKKKLNIYIRWMTRRIKNDFKKLIEQRFEQKKNKSSKNGSKKVNFSVVIPCYNLGYLIQDAIDSVLKQSLSGVEIIIVDDNSSDLSTKEKLDDLDSRVKIIRLSDNCGVAHARNIGIKKARSEYVICLDADDMIDSVYLEKAKNIFDTYENVGLVSCGLMAFGDERWEWMPKDKLHISEMLSDSPLHTASCFRKSLSVESGMYDEKMRGYEDWNHWISIAKQGCNVRVIPEYLFYYRTRANSKVKTSNKNIKALFSKIIENHKDLYEKHYDHIIICKHEEVIKLRNAQKRLTGFFLYRCLKKNLKEMNRIKNKYFSYGEK